MKPSVRSDGFLRLRLVIPVTQHGGVRPGAELPGSPPGDDLAVIVNDLNLRVICRVTDGLSSELDGVLGEGLKCRRTCLCHAECNRHLLDVELVRQGPAQLDGARRAA